MPFSAIAVVGAGLHLVHLIRTPAVEVERSEDAVGKGRRVRASRVDTKGKGVVPRAGAAFGLGPAASAPTLSKEPAPRVAPIATRQDGLAAGLRRSARLQVELAQLERLARARTGARQAVHALDEEISTEVAHGRVDGATWVQIGAALGISRQGARQQFGGSA